MGLVLVDSERGLEVLIKDAFSALSLKNICVEDCISAKIPSKKGLSHIIPYQFPTKSQRRYNRPFESLLPSVLSLIVFDNLQIDTKQTNFILSLVVRMASIECVGSTCEIECLIVAVQFVSKYY